MENNYGKGRLSVINEMMEWTTHQRQKIIASGTSGDNNPRQISNGGKLKALNNVLTKLRSKKEKTLLNDKG